MFKLEDLIVACSTVTAPPQQVGAEKRKDAEEYLLEFRRKASIQDCGDILRNCQVFTTELQVDNELFRILEFNFRLLCL